MAKQRLERDSETEIEYFFLTFLVSKYVAWEYQKCFSSFVHSIYSSCLSSNQNLELPSLDRRLPFRLLAYVVPS